MGLGSTMTLNRVERLQLKPLGGGGDVGQGLVSSQERRALKLGREANCHFQHSPLLKPLPSYPVFSPTACTPGPHHVWLGHQG